MTEGGTTTFGECGQPLPRGPRRALIWVLLVGVAMVLAAVAVDHARGGPEFRSVDVQALRPAFTTESGWSGITIPGVYGLPTDYVWRNDDLQPTPTAVDWSAWSEPLTMQAILYMRGPGGGEGRPGGGQWDEGQRLGRTAERLAAPLADDVAVWSTDCLNGLCESYQATIRYGRSIVQIGAGGIRSDQRLSLAQFDSYLHDVPVQMNRLAGR